MGRLTLILGGARSGKSTYAQRLAAERARRVMFIATAEAGDAEMAARIEAHQRERPGGWETLEAPAGIAATLAARPAGSDLFLLDCLSLLVSNLVLAAGGTEEEPDAAGAARRVDEEIRALLALIQPGAAEWIIVSNEVGLGLVPPYALGRLYRDLLGRANQQLAAAAAEVYFLVAGIPWPLHPYKG
jgi:adenosylcobinamide kinase/adenosylcobinamide-phosphate guanylyltransferase